MIEIVLQVINRNRNFLTICPFDYAKNYNGRRYPPGSPVAAVIGEAGEIDAMLFEDADTQISTVQSRDAASALLCITPKHFNSSQSLQSTLAHEFTHAIRALSRQRQGGASKRYYYRLEEFYGTLIGNIFKSSSGDNIGFSYGYSEAGGENLFVGLGNDPVFTRAVTDLTTAEIRSLSQNFANTHRDSLESLRLNNPELFRALATITTPAFNPIRDL